MCYTGVGGGLALEYREKGAGRLLFTPLKSGAK